MKRYLALVLLTSVFVHPAWAGPAPLPTAMPESVGLSSARLQRLAEAIRRDVEQGRMPGAVVAIARRGKLVYHEAFGFVDKAANAPMPKDAIFALASMTKPMAAVGDVDAGRAGRSAAERPGEQLSAGAQGHEGGDGHWYGAGAPAADAPGHAASHSRRQLRQSWRYAAAQAVLQPAAERGRRRPAHSSWRRSASCRCTTSRGRSGSTATDSTWPVSRSRR